MSVPFICVSVSVNVFEPGPRICLDLTCVYRSVCMFLNLACVSVSKPVSGPYVCVSVSKHVSEPYMCVLVSVPVAEPYITYVCVIHCDMISARVWL